MFCCLTLKLWKTVFNLNSHYVFSPLQFGILVSEYYIILNFLLDWYVLADIFLLCLFFSDSPLPVSSRVCFVKFHDPDSAVVAQHLTNTVFVDRALIVVPYAEGWCFV
jgi:hypothetical protein